MDVNVYSISANAVTDLHLVKDSGSSMWQQIQYEKRRVYDSENA